MERVSDEQLSVWSSVGLKGDCGNGVDVAIMAICKELLAARRLGAGAANCKSEEFDGYIDAIITLLTKEAEWQKKQRFVRTTCERNLALAMTYLTHQRTP